MLLSLVFLGVLGFQGDVKENQRVDFVLLDVAAFKGKGTPVTDLKASDFVVKERRKEVKITFFDVLDYRQAFEMGLTLDAPATATSEQTSEPNEKQLQQMAIVLDFEMYHIEEILGAFDHLTRFFDGLDPNYRYKILIYSLDKGMLTDGFVEDIAGAKVAIEDYRDKFYGYREKNPTWDQDNPIAGAAPTDHPKQWVEVGTIDRGTRQKQLGNLRRYDREIDARSFEAQLRDCLGNYTRGGGNKTSCACLDDVLDEFLNTVAMRTEGVIDRLVQLTYKFEGTSALKSMYFVSPGFVLEDVTAVYDLHRKYQIQSECGKPNITADTYTHLDRSRDEMPRRRKLEIKTDFRQVLHACVRNRIMFNTVHFYKGTYLGDLQSEFVKRNGQGLLELAEKSGGNYHQTGDLKLVLETDLAQNRLFYVLGYDSPKGRKGTYRRITVKCKRKGVKLRHRDGYYVY